MRTDLPDDLLHEIDRMPNVRIRTGSEEHSRKNVMGTIMFLDLVAYSKRSVDP